MANSSLVQARIDNAIKEEAAIVLASMGLTLSDAVRMLLVKIAKDHAMPFDPFTPNEKTIQAMKEAREGKLTSFANVNDLMADLNAPD
jgi:DNA-damage-inducible protein J